ncbi:MAG: hypothetical protein ABSG53_29035 [Thermoguttaceae bacterium]
MRPFWPADVGQLCGNGHLFTLTVFHGRRGSFGWEAKPIDLRTHLEFTRRLEDLASVPLIATSIAVDVQYGKRRKT